MNKKGLIVLSILGLFLLSAGKVWAVNYLKLTRIGTLSTSGILYSSWNYVGPSPDFAGTATAGATVALTVNAITSTGSADVLGTWVIKPTNLVTGQNSVSIASGNEMLSFILNYTLAATPTATPTVAPTASVAATKVTKATKLPETGNEWLMLGVVSVGMSVFLGGMKLKDYLVEKWSE